MSVHRFIRLRPSSYASQKLLCPKPLAPTIRQPLSVHTILMSHFGGRVDASAEAAAQHAADEVICKKARAEAERKFQQRDAKKKDADAAFGTGNKDAGHKLMAEYKELAAAAEAGRQAAAQTIFDMKNARVGPFEVDLHGLQVEEALGFVEERLDHDIAKGASPGVVLIYGAGHHSAGGTQVIKPAVLKALRDRPQGQLVETRVDWDAIAGKLNPGCVSVAYAGGSLDALLGKGKANADGRSSADWKGKAKQLAKEQTPAFVVVFTVVNLGTILFCYGLVSTGLDTAFFELLDSTFGTDLRRQVDGSGSRWATTLLVFALTPSAAVTFPLYVLGTSALAKWQPWVRLMGRVRGTRR